MSVAAVAGPCRVVAVAQSAAAGLPSAPEALVALPFSLSRPPPGPRGTHCGRRQAPVPLAGVVAVAAAARAAANRLCSRRHSRGPGARAVARRGGQEGVCGSSASAAGGRVGVVLLNIGTPVSTSIEDVTDYLGKFLGDDRVMEMESPDVKRAILRKILRSRPAKSAESYRKIWDPVRGSPLLYHSEDLAAGLRSVLGDSYEVCVGFQYSEPSVRTALARLMALSADRIVLVPMFPHFAQATVGAFLANTCAVAEDLRCTAYLQVAPPFYRHPGYIEAVHERVAGAVGPCGEDVDHTVFSFHGIPETQCTRTDETEGVCMKVPDCCSRRCAATRNCYRSQCMETALLLAESLGLRAERWSVSFQSRATLRKAIRWTTPFTDELLAELAAAGKRKVAICSPSYVADCIETLGELGHEGRELFERAGGEELRLIPCMNSSDVWARNLARMIREMPSSRAAAAAGPRRGYWAM